MKDGNGTGIGGMKDRMGRRLRGLGRMKDGDGMGINGDERLGMGRRLRGFAQMKEDGLRGVFFVVGCVTSFEFVRLACLSILRFW